MSVGITIERVGDGVLATWDNGATLYFERAVDAAQFGISLYKVATLGSSVLDQLDEPETP